MKTIEEIAFTVNGTKCSYKLYKYEEETLRKVKVPKEAEDITAFMDYKHIKVKVTKYALHQEFEANGKLQERLVCETEMYATILTILKGILTEYIKIIDKDQTLTI